MENKLQTKFNNLLTISDLRFWYYSGLRMTLGCEFHFHSMQRPESIEMHIIKITFSPCSAEPLDLSWLSVSICSEYWYRYKKPTALTAALHHYTWSVFTNYSYGSDMYLGFSNALLKIL